MRIVKLAGLAIALAAMTVSPLFAQDDIQGSKDHPSFTRMPGYFISSFSRPGFDRFSFEEEGGAPVAVDGRKTEIVYRPKDGVKVASPLQIGRNYQNAATRIGGVVLFEDLGSGGGATTLRIVRGSDEIWARVGIGDSGQNYTVTIIEKAAMRQEVVASADVWKSDIGATGHAAIYGIHFDTDKAVIKPESAAALQEIAKLLQQNPKLNVMVVGHTDLTGELPHNMTLSEARAKAVASALTTRHGIAASRLSAYGCGPLAPVASNKSEEGRAKNRRVDLVER